jgi:hypothetical protein
MNHSFFEAYNTRKTNRATARSPPIYPFTNGGLEVGRSSFTGRKSAQTKNKTKKLKEFVQLKAVSELPFLCKLAD